MGGTQQSKASTLVSRQRICSFWLLCGAGAFIVPSKSLGGGNLLNSGGHRKYLVILYRSRTERNWAEKKADRGINLHYRVKICTHSHVLEKTQSFLTSALTSRSAVWRRRKGGGWRFCRHRPVHTFPRETKQEMLCGVRRILQRVSALLQKFCHRTSNKMGVFRESARRRSTHSQVNTTGRASTFSTKSYNMHLIDKIENEDNRY